MEGAYSKDLSGSSEADTKEMGSSQAALKIGAVAPALLQMAANDKLLLPATQRKHENLQLRAGNSGRFSVGLQTNDTGGGMQISYGFPNTKCTAQLLEAWMGCFDTPAPAIFRDEMTIPSKGGLEGIKEVRMASTQCRKRLQSKRMRRAVVLQVITEQSCSLEMLPQKVVNQGLMGLAGFLKLPDGRVYTLVYLLCHWR